MIRLSFIAAVLALSAVPATAQLMGARELTTAAPVKGAPGSQPVADIYFLVGEVGAKESFTLTVKGPASLTLFSPGGYELLSAEGSGTVKLTVVLPLTDVYTLAVARKVPAQPYSLSRKATKPTLAEAILSEGVGIAGSYTDENGKAAQTSDCWLIPGIKARRIYPGVIDEMTLAADRATTMFVSRRNGQTATGQVTYTIDGTTITRFTKNDHGMSKKSDMRFDEVMTEVPEAGPSSYLCNDAPGK